MIDNMIVWSDSLTLWPALLTELTTETWNFWIYWVMSMTKSLVLNVTAWTLIRTYKFKSSNPITDLDRPWGFQEAEVPRFKDNRHMKVVRLSSLRTGRHYPQEMSHGTH